LSGIYIHIPFCRQACSYCDFYFVTRDRLIPEFVDALVHEITAVPAGDGSPFPGDPVRTLYLGGGTPSRLPLSQFERIFNALYRHFDLSGLTECTVEVNPEDVTTEWLARVRDRGVTRLSMGIQSFQPELLEFMHRAHSAPEAHKALERVVYAGFTSFSVDLIYGCPGQTDAQLRDDLEQLLAYDPPHLSAYSLTIEPRTRLGKQAELGRLNPADDEMVARQSRLVRDVLGANGIHQYEISNYARHGHEAEHNSAYWRHENYLGMGPAAHSFYWPGGGLERRPRTGMQRGTQTGMQRGARSGMQDGKRLEMREELQEKPTALRWYHDADIHSWARSVQSEAYRIWMDAAISPVPDDVNVPERPGVPEGLDIPESLEFERLSLASLAGEYLMTGLRTRSGVDPEVLSARYAFRFSDSQQRRISVFREQGWIAPEYPLRLTREGYDLADAIILRLLE